MRKEKKVKMVGPCFEIAEQQPGKSGAKVDSTREAQEGQAQNNMAARRSVEAELRDAGLTWETASKQAKDRQKWRSLVEATCAT